MEKGFVEKCYASIFSQRSLTFIERLPSSLDISNIMKGHFFYIISTVDNLLFAHNSGFSCVASPSAFGLTDTFLENKDSVRRLRGQ